MKRTALIASALCLALGAFSSFAEDKMENPDKTDKMGKMEKSDRMGKTQKSDKMGRAEKSDRMDKPGAMQ